MPLVVRLVSAWPTVNRGVSPSRLDLGYGGPSISPWMVVAVVVVGDRGAKGSHIMDSHDEVCLCPYSVLHAQQNL